MTTDLSSETMQRDNRATSLESWKEKDQARLLYPAKIFLKEYFSKNVFQNEGKNKDVFWQ